MIFSGLNEASTDTSAMLCDLKDISGNRYMNIGSEHTHDHYIKDPIPALMRLSFHFLSECFGSIFQLNTLMMVGRDKVFYVYDSNTAQSTYSIFIK